MGEERIWNVTSIIFLGCSPLILAWPGERGIVPCQYLIKINRVTEKPVKSSILSQKYLTCRVPAETEGDYFPWLVLNFVETGNRRHLSQTWRWNEKHDVKMGVRTRWVVSIVRLKYYRNGINKRRTKENIVLWQGMLIFLRSRNTSCGNLRWRNRFSVHMRKWHLVEDKRGHHQPPGKGNRVTKIV